MISRRAFVGGALTTLAWTPGLRLTADALAAVCGPAPVLPHGLEPYRHGYENWERQIVVDEVWSVSPRTPEDVVALADWAAANGWRLRARGSAHGWSPLTLLPGESCDARVLLVDTLTHLDALTIEGEAVRAQPGVLLKRLAEDLLAAGLELPSIPTTGTISVGGMLAVAAHGCVGEEGSVAGMVTSLTAVVWDAGAGRHVQRRFPRSHPDFPRLLSALGRAFITEATFAARPLRTMRCLSRVDVPASTLFGRSGGADSFAARLDATERVEVLWYPYTEGTWVKEWTVAPQQPVGSRAVTGPYNYPFTEQVPVEMTDLAERMVEGAGALTPAYSQAAYAGTVAGLQQDEATDLWGPSPYLFLHHEGENVRIHEAGFVLLTRRSELQRVISTFAAEYRRMLGSYALRNSFPINNPAYIRATGLDHGDRAPALSAARATGGYDVAIWFTLVCFPGTPGHGAFLAELERFARGIPGALARSEWAKGWAYTAAGGWTSAEQIAHLRAPFPDFAETRRALARLDPGRVFTNPFLDRLFG